MNERKIERLKKNFQDYLEMALNRQVSQFKHWREADYGIARGPAQYWWQPLSMALERYSRQSKVLTDDLTASRRLKRGRHPTGHCNSLQAKVNWQFTAKNGRVKRKRLYPTLAS